MSVISLQLERLRRHHDMAYRTFDDVALLDLSHTLRYWTEMRGPIKDLAPEFFQARCFKVGSPRKKNFRLIRPHRYALAYLPDGVRCGAGGVEFGSYIEAGRHALDSPNAFSQIMGKKGQPTSVMGICVFSSYEPVDKLISHYVCVFEDLDRDDLSRLLRESSIDRVTFGQWLDSVAVRFAYAGADGGRIEDRISLEMLIKRVANSLDGSHPSLAGGSTNEADPHVRHLLQFRAGGVPLPYAVLLKAAQDLLEAGRRYLAHL